jgi:hypothetical protein
MSCRHLEPLIVDLARGVATGQDAQLVQHVRRCPRCAGRLEQERVMSAALARLAADLADPPLDPEREPALLARFDTWCSRPSPHTQRAGWAPLVAAGVAIAAVLSWASASHSLYPSAGPAVRQTGRATVPVTAAPSAPSRATTGTALVVPAVTNGTAAADPGRATISVDVDGFIPWPGAATWPPFESGELVRVELPVEALPALGLATRASGMGMFVQADVLVGQDGFARAVRVVD